LGLVLGVSHGSGFGIAPLGLAIFLLLARVVQDFLAVYMTELRFVNWADTARVRAMRL